MTTAITSNRPGKISKAKSSGMPEGIRKGYHRRRRFENGGGGIGRRLSARFGRRGPWGSDDLQANQQRLGGQWRGDQRIVLAAVGEGVDERSIRTLALQKRF